MSANFHCPFTLHGNDPPDLDWYLRQQIHPPVARVCEPIEGTDAAQIASCLGMDPSKFTSSSAANAAAEAGRFKTLSSQLTDEQRYAEATPLKLLCRACNTRSEVTAIFHKGLVCSYLSAR